MGKSTEPKEQPGEAFRDRIVRGGGKVRVRVRGAWIVIVKRDSCSWIVCVVRERNVSVFVRGRDSSLPKVARICP